MKNINVKVNTIIQYIYDLIALGIEVSPHLRTHACLSRPLHAALSHCRGGVQALSIFPSSLAPQKVLAFWLSLLPPVKTSLPRLKCEHMLWSPRIMYGLKVFLPLLLCPVYLTHVGVSPCFSKWVLVVIFSPQMQDPAHPLSRIKIAEDICCLAI